MVRPSGAAGAGPEVDALPHPAEDLSSDDDLLSWILVDQLGCLPNTKLGVHPQQVKFVGPAFKTAEVLDIVQHTIVLGNLPGAMQALQEFPLIKSHLEAKSTDGQRERFIQHLRRYLLVLLPNSRMEIHTTNRYSSITGHTELAIYATRNLLAGAVMQELQGSVVPLPDAWREELDLGDDFIGSANDAGREDGEGDNDDEEKRGARRSDRTKRRDFSIVWSGLKRCYQLFLGPARFLNHDCEPNVELLRQGKFVTFRVIKPIRIGDELTTFYGDSYFGKDNIECLCLTCERAGKGGFTSKPTPSSKSRSRSSSTIPSANGSINGIGRGRGVNLHVPKNVGPSSLRASYGVVNPESDDDAEPGDVADDDEANSIAGPSHSQSIASVHDQDDGLGAEAPTDPRTPVRGRTLNLGDASVGSPATESTRSESPSDVHRPKRARYERKAVKNAKALSFLKRPKASLSLLDHSKLLDNDDHDDEDSIRCVTCAKVMHERIWFNNRYFDHCARCVRHALIFDLPWPAHRPKDVMEYPPSHLIPLNYIPPRISTIPLPSLDKNRRKLVEPLPPSPSRADSGSGYSRESGHGYRATTYRKLIAAAEFEVEQLREAAWTLQDSKETSARSIALAKIRAKEARLEAKRLKNANKVKGSGLWSRYEYVSEDEIQKRLNANRVVLSGTRRGGTFRDQEDDNEMKRLAEIKALQGKRKRRGGPSARGKGRAEDVDVEGEADASEIEDVQTGTGHDGNDLNAVLGESSTYMNGRGYSNAANGLHSPLSIRPQIKTNGHGGPSSPLVSASANGSVANGHPASSSTYLTSLTSSLSSPSVKKDVNGNHSLSGNAANPSSSLSAAPSSRSPRKPNPWYPTSTVIEVDSSTDEELATLRLGTTAKYGIPVGSEDDSDSGEAEKIFDLDLATERFIHNALADEDSDIEMDPVLETVRRSPYKRARSSVSASASGKGKGPAPAASASASPLLQNRTPPSVIGVIAKTPTITPRRREPVRIDLEPSSESNAAPLPTRTPPSVRRRGRPPGTGRHQIAAAAAAARAVLSDVGAPLVSVTPVLTPNGRKTANGDANHHVNGNDGVGPTTTVGDGSRPLSLNGNIHSPATKMDSPPKGSLANDQIDVDVIHTVRSPSPSPRPPVMSRSSSDISNLYQDIEDRLVALESPQITYEYLIEGKDQDGETRFKSMREYGTSPYPPPEVLDRYIDQEQEERDILLLAQGGRKPDLSLELASAQANEEGADPDLVSAAAQRRTHVGLPGTRLLAPGAKPHSLSPSPRPTPSPNLDDPSLTPAEVALWGSIPLCRMEPDEVVTDSYETRYPLLEGVTVHGVIVDPYAVGLHLETRSRSGTGTGTSAGQTSKHTVVPRSKLAGAGPWINGCLRLVASREIEVELNPERMAGIESDGSEEDVLDLGADIDMDLVSETEQVRFAIPRSNRTNDDPAPLPVTRLPISTYSRNFDVIELD